MPQDPSLHHCSTKAARLRGTSSRKAAVVPRDVVRGLRLRDVIVQEELLLDAVPVGLAALLVSRHLFAGQVCEGTLAAAQSSPPILCNLLGLLRGSRTATLAGLLGLAALGLQGLCVERLAPLVRHPHQCRVVDVAVRLIVGPKELQGLRNIHPALDRSATPRHLLEQARLSFPRPRLLPDGLPGIDARHPRRETAAMLPHGCRYASRQNTKGVDRTN